MTLFALNPIQHENYSFLIRLRDFSQTHPVDAALTYGIDREAIERYAKLTDEDVLSLAYESAMSVAVPRYNCFQLNQLLSKPVHVRGVFAVALDANATQKKRARSTCRAKQRLGD